MKLRSGPLLTIFLLLGIAAEVHAQDPDAPEAEARPLSETRTEDRAWGISFRAPLYTHVVREPTGRYLMQVTDDDEKFTVLIWVRQAAGKPTLEQMSRTARKDVDAVSTITNLLHERQVAYGERPAVLFYYQVADPLRPAQYRLVGQAIVQIARGKFAILELACAFEDEKPSRKTFEAMLETLEFADPQDLEARRRDAVKLGADFLARLTPQKLHEALVPDQHFRIVETVGRREPKDVGWARVLQVVTEQNGKPGVGIEVQSRWFAEGVTYDSLEQYFHADDETLEMWRTTVTRRDPAEKPDATVNRNTLTETGIRTRAQIHVTLDSPQGTEKFQLVRSDTAYLSRVHALLLPRLLPADLPATYGFYHYHPLQRKVVLRTDQLSPTFSGFTLESAPSLNEEANRSIYNAQKQALEWAVTPTRKLLPTTAAELKKRWPKE